MFETCFMKRDPGPWASKAGGRVPHSRKISGGRPPRNYDISVSFFSTQVDIFKIKWPKSEEKLNFGGTWVWVPMNPSPQTKLRGDAPAQNYGQQIICQIDFSGSALLKSFSWARVTGGGTGGGGTGPPQSSQRLTLCL